jgi:hypothetical protein
MKLFAIVLSLAALAMAAPLPAAEPVAEPDLLVEKADQCTARCDSWHHWKA